MRRFLLLLAALAVTGCGAASPRAAEPAPDPGAETASTTPAPAPASTPARLAVSREVTIAADATCTLPATTCDAATPCPVQLVTLTPDSSACVTEQTEDVAQVLLVRGLVAAGDHAWIDTDQGVFGHTQRGWERDVDLRGTDDVPQLVFGTDVWRMPRELELTECHSPVVHCRGGRPKCAMPMPECTPVPDLVLATHGPTAQAVTMPNPLAGSTAPYRGGMPEREPLVAMAGTSARDVWVLSAARLFHWDGHTATAVPLDAEDPIVRLVSDPSGVYAATRAGRRMQAVEGAWQPLPEQPGPFLGQPVEAPPHPFAVLDEAIATGPDAFWARGHVRAFASGPEAAPCVVRFERGTYRTWIGGSAQRRWLRAGDGALDTMRVESGNVVVDDARTEPGMFPFLEVLWQQPRDLLRLASGELLVATPLGLFGLTGAQWTRHHTRALDALAADADMVAASGGGLLLLREAGGFCPALELSEGHGGGLVVAYGRAWLAPMGRLYSVDAAHHVEEWSLRLGDASARVERVLADDATLRVFARTSDGHTLTTRFDGTTWSPAITIGSEPFYGAVGSSSTEIRTDTARFDGHCWSHVTSRAQPLVAVPEGASVRAELVGAEEADLVLRIVPAP